jgi:hypothetical protein
MTLQWLQRGTPFETVSGAGSEEEGLGVFDAPRLADIKIDGDLADWGDGGLEVALLNGEKGELPPADSLEARMRLGWDDRGLLVAVTVRDDVPLEEIDDTKLWGGDSLELFMAKGLGSKDFYQTVIAPGEDEWFPELRTRVYDHRRTRSGKRLAVEAAKQKIDGGYQVEVLLPWANLRIRPAMGQEIAFQIYVNDTDLPDRRKKAVWHPATDSHQNSTSMQRIRLGASAGGPVRAVAGAQTDEEAQAVQIHVVAVGELAENQIEIRSGSLLLGQGALVPTDGWAVADIALPAPPEGKRYGAMTVFLGGQPVAPVSMPPGAWVSPPDPVQVRYACMGSEEYAAVLTACQRLPGSDLHVMRARLEGLEPDTAYHFAFGEGPAHRSFRTAPAHLDRPLVFAAGGDARDTDRAALVSRQAVKCDPLFALIGGDLGWGDGERPDDYVRFLEGWQPTLITRDGRLIPSVFCIGNHEVIGGNKKTRGESLVFNTLVGLFPEHNYNVLDFGDYLSLILLDSEHTETIDGPQKKWLEETLQARKSVPHVLAAYHVPAFPSNRDPNESASTRIRQHWLPLLEKSPVRVVFESHDHTYKRTKPIKGIMPSRDGIVFLGDGAWGMEPREVRSPSETWYLAKAKSVMHFLRVTLDGSRQSFEAIDTKGRVFDRCQQ